MLGKCGRPSRRLPFRQANSSIAILKAEPQMTEPDPVIARRVLLGRTEQGDQVIAVSLFAPAADGENWSCAYEVDWPEAPRRNAALGVDSMQALVLALQMLGAELHAGRPVQIQSLEWLGTDGSLGLPLPPSLRAEARGDDKLI